MSNVLKGYIIDDLAAMINNVVDKNELMDIMNRVSNLKLKNDSHAFEAYPTTISEENLDGTAYTGYRGYIITDKYGLSRTVPTFEDLTEENVTSLLSLDRGTYKFFEEESCILIIPFTVEDTRMRIEIGGIK